MSLKCEPSSIQKSVSLKYEPSSVQKSMSLKYEPSSEQKSMSLKYEPSSGRGFAFHQFTKKTEAAGNTPSSSLFLSSLELSDTKVYEP